MLMRQRGQSLLETTVALAVLLLAVAIGAGAVSALARNVRPSQSRLAALGAVADATTELLAATAYDPAALARVAPAQWNAGSVTIAAVVRTAGQARVVDIHYAGSAASGDISVTLRAATVPPGALLDATVTAP